ncbi:hypothetical protein RJ640_010514 [Escallonia rubra]|uniref:Uncharacterized protein n=1 Tax=Escallonia rubra TaxID=112253 RepID=A0AA88U1P2_9ASTE|nr:hypothetical protein RJ640_010514 [Escallonia rubra]
MKNQTVNVEKDDQKAKDPLKCLSKDMEPTEDDMLSQTVITKVNQDHVLLVSVRKSQMGGSCTQESIGRSLWGLDNRIPKQIMCNDEKYLRRCLELIHFSALKAASCNIPSEFGVLLENLNSRSRYNLVRFANERPLAVVSENVAVGSTGDSILGTISGSKSMINILSSPLLRKLGAFDSDVGTGSSSFIDVREPLFSDVRSSLGGLCIGSPQKLQKDMVGDYTDRPEPVHKRLVSVSSTRSTISDNSPSVSSPGFQGMLQCTWNDGIPHYVFSLDDQKENYIANLFKVESSDDKVSNYVYMFHLRAGCKSENEFNENVSDLVGKLRVSSSFTVCPNNTKIMESQFVLLGPGNSCLEEMQTSSHNSRKNKGLSKKVVNIFRGSRSSKQRTYSKIGETSSVLDYCSWEPWQDSGKNADLLSRPVHPESYAPNLELAAIIVKHHMIGTPKEEEIGGWGMKFLKKVRRSSASQEPCVPSECCQQDTGDRSTSITMLVPAGLHGGPRTRNGGPSSLIERWRSGGLCDCGGWDIGCPLTVLSTRPGQKEVSPRTNISGESKTFDLYIQGSNEGAPVMQMVNIHDGLYYIHFKPTLSALQSFSIAVATIHTHSFKLSENRVKLRDAWTKMLRGGRNNLFIMNTIVRVIFRSCPSTEMICWFFELALARDLESLLPCGDHFLVWFLLPVCLVEDVQEAF